MQKANPDRPRKLFGIDEIAVPTSQAGLPYSYFSGTRGLAASWIMNPIVAYQTGTHVGKNDGAKAKNASGSPTLGLVQQLIEGTKRQSNLVYGHCAARLCLGQLDFIWGILINNELAWPFAAPWFQTTWLAGSIVAKAGRLYATPSNTTAIPPAAPWYLWNLPLVAGVTPNPLKISINTFGDTYLYYGTANQTLSATENILLSHDHPAYRNQSVLVLKLFQFGADSASPPAITVLGGRKPAQTIITGAATDFDADWQVNPWCVLAEILTHPILGLGLPTAWFDAATWQDEADRCAANPELYYISPMFTSLKKVREIVADLLGYPNAFIFWSTIGALTAGHWPRGEAAPAFGAGNTIDRNDLVQEIIWDTDTWDDTVNSVTVNYQDIQAAFKDRPVTANNLFNQAITRRVQSTSVDRPFIVRSKQAAAWAAEAVKMGADQTFKATSTVRAEKASDISPGTIFRLTDDVLQISAPQRCTKKTISAAPAGTVRLAHEVERGVSPTPYSATPENPEAPQADPPSRIEDFLIAQLPTALAGVPNSICLLAGRTNDFTSAIDLWFQQADGAAYQHMPTVRAFAVAGVSGFAPTETTIIATPTLGTTYNLKHGGVDVNGAIEYGTVDVENQFLHGTGDGSLIEDTHYFVDYERGTITFDASASGFFTAGIDAHVSYKSGFGFTPDASTPQADLDAISGALTKDEILDNEFLIFVYNATDGLGIFSLCAIHATSTAGFYYLYALPAYGSGSLLPWRAHASQIFVIKRQAIQPLTHVSFPGLASAGATANFLLAPQSAISSDITDIYDAITNPTGLVTQTAFTFGNPFAPTATLVSMLRGNVQITAPFSATNFTTTDVTRIVVDLVDANTDLNHVTITADMGTNRILLLSRALPASKTQTVDTQFSLPMEGVWTINCVVTDSSGNSSETELVEMHVRVAGYPLPSPKIYSYTKIGIVVTKLVFVVPTTFGGTAQTGLAAKYQLVARGQPYNPAGWTAVSGTPTPPSGKVLFGPIPPFWSGYYTLYAKITKAASSDSQIVSWNL